jgi:hypothetical protein
VTVVPDPLPQICTVLPGPGWATLCADTAGTLLWAQPVVTGWLAPDIESANRIVLDLALLIQHVVERGGAAYLAEDRSGTAVWAAAAEPLPPVARLRRSTVDPHYAARWATLEDVLRSTASDDGGRGQLLVLLAGAGDGPIAGQRTAALLRHHHRVLDQQQRPAYTAALTIELRWLLTRHGWTTGPRRHLPDGSPWWPMRREPQPPATPVAPFARPATCAATTRYDEAPR